ncbi:DNA translocase FtsK [Neobacillus sp. SM06]|uniref:DNA translocase FtsK n=1 Tax=Neobacillus sp. SM06 TaxID=3422492 RepID=UPI003D2D62C7
MDARIAYQYPKGKFRFPIIPDEAIGHEKRKPKQTQPLVNQEKRKPKQVQPPVNQEKRKENDPPLKKQPSPRVFSTAPFRPTEIPSPIFGFQRPKNSSEPIEHVLSDFSPPLESQVPQMAQWEEEERERTEEKISQTNTDVFPAKRQDHGHVNESSALVEEIVENEVLQPGEETFVSVSAGNEPKESEESLEPKKQRRQHLPFNVMMLKSDKKKWDEKKKHPWLSEKIAAHQTAAATEEHCQAETTSKPAQIIEKKEASNPLRSNLLQQENQFTRPVSEQMIQSEEVKGSYQFPAVNLLHPPVAETMDFEWVDGQTDLLNRTLQNFNVGANVVNVTQGPSVTRFEVQPEPGVKVNKVTNLTDDIKLSLAARDIRIEAPIPGKHTIGIEVPNQKSRPVLIREIIQSEIFRQSSSPLTAVLGLDISGKPIVTDLKKMPHGLIAGATGSGKSVCINSILTSLMFKASPNDVKLLLIDPKMVELAPYNRIPHLVSPVITDVKAATAALKWAVDEMERRYELFAHTGVRDINRFNELAQEHKRYADKLPFIVIVIDELADLMMMSPADVEEAICRIAQKARACGIHLIIATQRPSVDVITGLIKANVPTRIAFSVSSQIDSRTIIDIGGAEKLLGRGDMLFLENGSSKPVRLQGTFVSDEEIDTVVAHVREQQEPDYLFEQEELLKKARISDEEDELFYEACEFVVEQGGASTSSLQRRFKIGYNRAARLMDLMEQQGFISGANGSKPREVYITPSDLESIQEAN